MNIYYYTQNPTFAPRSYILQSTFQGAKTHNVCAMHLRQPTKIVFRTLMGSYNSQSVYLCVLCYMGLPYSRNCIRFGQSEFMHIIFQVYTVIQQHFIFVYFVFIYTYIFKICKLEFIVVNLSLQSIRLQTQGHKLELLNYVTFAPP